MEEKFKFSEESTIKVLEIIKKYPEAKQRSAVMPLLYLVQEQNDNWIPKSAMDHVAEILSIPPMYVYEVANFYTMYNKKPIGKYLLQVCRTTPCWLCGSNDIVTACKNELGIDVGETTEDNLFSLIEVECLGACTAAPMMQVNDKYYENLDRQKTVELLRELRESSTS